VKEAAEKWGSGNRIVTLYCAENKNEGDLTRLLAARSIDITDREEGAMPEESLALGLKTFATYIVPAIEPEYLTKFPEIIVHFN